MTFAASQHTTSSTLEIRDCGLVPYEVARATQLSLQSQLIAGTCPEVLLLCEHPAVITIGKSGKHSNIIASERELRRYHVSVIEVERGGDVTYHGPGQIILYPILDLRRRRQDVGWYMRSLEEVIIRALTAFGLKAGRVNGKTGVWVGDSPQERKLASLGVRISRWCTMHGIALNVNNATTHQLPLLDGFRLLHPCGLVGVRMTSVEQEIGQRLDETALKMTIIDEFLRIFPPLPA